MVMYTFGYWIKIYRPFTMGGYPKNACPLQLPKLLTKVINTTFIQITVLRVYFLRIKVIQHCQITKC